MSRTTLIALVILVAALAGSVGSAAHPRIWLENASSLADGETDGLAITRDGMLFLAPAIKALHGDRTEGAPAHLWSLVEASSGTVYAGTGPDGKILEFGSTGAGKLFFQAPEPMITALTLGADGSLYAATAPGGKIYRIDAAGTGRVWCETGRGYIWDLAFAGDGTLYAAAGEPAGILRITRTGTASDWFESRDAHVVRIVPFGDEWFAATSGAGRVYRIDRDGNGFVVHQDNLVEASDLLVLKDGTLFISYLNPPAGEPQRPAVTINLADSSNRGASDPTSSRDIGTIDDEEGAVIRGVIEGLPTEKDDRVAGRVRGRVVQVRPDGRAESIWQSSGAAAFSLALDIRDRVLFGTGEPARVYRYDGEDVALLQTLPGAQTTALGRGNRRAVIGTSSPFGIYRLDGAPSTGGVFVSRAFDAGSATRWGTIRWETVGSGSRVELYTRTGNSAPADDTWSAWSPALSNSAGSPIVNPEGRYLQWRIRLPSSASEEVKVGEVAVAYQPYNQPPSVKGLRLDGDPAGVSGSARIRWSSYDPDDDPVQARFEIRRDGEDWSAIPRSPGEDGLLTSGQRKGWRDDQWEWDTTAHPEGRYRIRLRYTDIAANAPGEGHDRLHDRTLRLSVDRTPPEIDVVAEDGRWRIGVLDTVSRLNSVQVLQGSEVLYSLRPEDGVLDSGQERFSLTPSALASMPGPFSIRAIDDAGNEAAQEISPP